MYINIRLYIYTIIHCCSKALNWYQPEIPFNKSCLYGRANFSMNIHLLSKHIVKYWNLSNWIRICGIISYHITSNHIMNTYSCVYIHIFTPPLKRLHLSPPLRHRQAVPVAWRDAPGSYAPARRRSPVAAPKGPRSWLQWPRCVPANEAGSPRGNRGPTTGCWSLLVIVGWYRDI